MQDLRYNKLAKLLVNYSTDVGPGDLVAITALSPAEPLIKELFREILEAGGHPYYLPRAYPPYYPGLENPLGIFINNANKEQLNHTDIFYKKVVEDFDVLISILSESNLQSYAFFNSEKEGQYSKTHTGVTHTYFERLSTRELRRVLTIFPTQGAAQFAEMPLDDYEDFFFDTIYCDANDPVKVWKGIAKDQEKIVTYLNGKEKVEIKGPHIDLSFSIKDRTFISCAGEVNMPDGEIFTGPVEDSVNGWVHFTYPDYTSGVEITDIKLEFVNGRVEKASASKNEEKLMDTLNRDEGARYLGEFGIGTNERVNRFVRNMLSDEKIGGTIHFALGHGYPESGSKNESSIHRDLLCDMKDGGQIFIDDELIYESGKFTIS